MLRQHRITIHTLNINIYCDCLRCPYSVTCCTAVWPWSPSICVRDCVVMFIVKESLDLTVWNHLHMMPVLGLHYSTYTLMFGTVIILYGLGVQDLAFFFMFVETDYPYIEHNPFSKLSSSMELQIFFSSYVSFLLVARSVQCVRVVGIIFIVQRNINPYIKILLTCLMFYLNSGKFCCLRTQTPRYW